MVTRQPGQAPPPRWRALAVAMVAAAVLGASPPAGAAALAPPTIAYVALGDSYAAGPGIPTQVSVACERSDHDYPALVAAALQVATFTDASCSGASTADLTGTQSSLGMTVPPQLNAVTTGTTLVTLSIAGNDIGFASIIATCMELALTNLAGAPCEAHYTAGGTDQLRTAIAAAEPRVAAVLDAIHARAPTAAVLLVGYPDLLPPSGPGCWPFAPFAAGDVPYLNGVEVALNQMLAGTAAGHGAKYVDTYTPSLGHDMCETIEPAWVQGLLPVQPGAAFHPDEAGMAADAADVVAALR